jgi:hypothetical protein
MFVCFDLFRLISASLNTVPLSNHRSATIAKRRSLQVMKDSALHAVYPTCFCSIFYVKAVIFFLFFLPDQKERKNQAQTKLSTRAQC